MTMLKNWQTTLSGVTGLVALVAKCVAAKAINAEDFAAASICIGLIFAKDGNVTGGTRQQ